MKRRFQTIAVLLVTIGLLTPAVRAKARAIKGKPINQLIKNAERVRKKHPDSYRNYYVLGRLHAMAFAREEQNFSVSRETKLSRNSSIDPHDTQQSFPGLRPYFQRVSNDALTQKTPDIERVPDFRQALKNTGSDDPDTRERAMKTLVSSGPWNSEPSKIKQFLSQQSGRRNHEPSPAQKDVLKRVQRYYSRIRHFHQSMYNYEEARRRKKNDPKLLLGLAWGYKAAGKFSSARTYYRKTFNLAYKTEKNKTYTPIQGADEWHGSYAKEAGSVLIELLEALKKQGEIQPGTASRNIEKIRGKLETITIEQGRARSPIIIPLGDSNRFQDLRAPGARVRFDLIADGVERTWNWVSPQAGFLAWLPEDQSRIRSGRQLFGNDTWNIQWKTGYGPLKLLDDDGNGWLQNNELNHLVIWQDRNQNGRSEPSEITPVRKRGITGINTNISRTTSGIPQAKKGVRFRDGTIRPSYDWYAKARPKKE